MTVEPDDHGLGRSRGGLTTKLHLAVEQGQKPMSIVITAGQRGDSPQFEPVLNKIRVPRLGPGRPRTRPDRVRADKTPMQLAGQAAAARRVGAGVLKAMASSNFWWLVRQWWSWPSMRLNRLRRAAW